MKTKLLAAGAIAGLAMVLGVAGPAQAAPPENAAKNHASYWEMQGYGDCVKVEFRDGVRGYTVPMGSDYSVLILKAGSGSGAHQVIENPTPGMTYYHWTGKDLSHVIYCTEACAY